MNSKIQAIPGQGKGFADARDQFIHIGPPVLIQGLFHSHIQPDQCLSGTGHACHKTDALFPMNFALLNDLQ